MCRLFCSILIILTIGKIQQSAGLKWIPLTTGDKIPENAVLILDSKDIYIGRSRHFDTVLPAEVYVNGTASVTCCGEIIPKDQFEILTVNESCQWEVFNDFDQVSENIVQGGTDYAGVPIYVGQQSFDNEVHILYFFLRNRDWRGWRWSNNYNPSWHHSTQYYLSCESPTKWVDTSSVKIPIKTVSGGKSEDGHEIFVARLKRDCEIVTGYVIPEMGTALAILANGERIQSEYCQVLIAEPNEYTWEGCSEGEIPDNAVVQGKNGPELTYIARWNNTIGHLTQSEALHIFDYEVLVKIVV